MSDDNVVKLCEVARGYTVDDLEEWGKDWLEAIGTGEYGKANTLALVIQRVDGKIAVISQSLSQNLTGTALIGLLTIAAHRLSDGEARIEDLKESE